MRHERLAFYQGVAVGLLCAVALRALLSTLFHASLATLRLNPSATWALVLLAPLAALLVRSPRWPLAVAALAAGALPFVRFTGAHIPVAALAAGSALLALATLRGRGLAGALAGVALAGAVLVALDSRDLAYFRGGALLMALALLAFVAPDREEDRPRLRAAAEPAGSARRPRNLRVSSSAGVALAIALAIQLALFASPYALARLSGLPPWGAALAALGGLLVGATLLPGAGRWLLVAGAVGALDLAFVRSPLVAVSIALLQAALGASLRQGAPHPAAVALVFAPLAFVLTFFLGMVPGWALPAAGIAVLALAWPARGARPHRSRGAPVALLALVVLALWPAQAATAPEGRELTVVSWNIHQGFGNRGGLDPDLYLDVLREVDADIILLQETARGELSSGGLDSVLHLAGALGMSAAYGTPGVAVLSKHPLGDDERPPVAPGSLEAPVVVDGETVWVHSVHLARSATQRAQEAQEILAAARARPGARILAGDLNSCPGSTCFGGRPSDGIHQTLATVYDDTWTSHHDATDPAGNTHPAWSPSRRIDVVMVTGLEVIEARPLRDERTALGSDHLPVLARLRLP